MERTAMMEEKTMRLWTIQTPLAWSLLQQKKVLIGDGRRIYPHFRTAYQWLKGQMLHRTVNYGGHYPIWFWTRKPDFRKSSYWNYSKRGVPIVLLECVIPTERVLLSDFETWHVVLNNGYLALSEEAWHEWYARHDAGLITPEQTIMDKSESWKYIFDFEALSKNPDWNGNPDRIQATVEALRLEEVVKVRVITLKRTTP